MLSTPLKYLVSGLEHSYFSIYWEESSQLTFIFFRGVETINQIWLHPGVMSMRFLATDPRTLGCFFNPKTHFHSIPCKQWRSYISHRISQYQGDWLPSWIFYYWSKVCKYIYILYYSIFYYFLYYYIILYYFILFYFILYIFYYTIFYCIILYYIF